MTRPKNWCQFDCGREATLVMHNGTPTVCSACYVRTRYAIEKGVTWMLNRARQVGSFQNSLAAQLGEVATKKNAKKRRRAA